MAHRQWEFNDRICKFLGKSSHECYKLIWQWTKEKTIGLSLFEALCEAATLRIKKPAKQQIDEHVRLTFQQYCDEHSEQCDNDDDCIACALLWAKQKKM